MFRLQSSAGISKRTAYTENSGGYGQCGISWCGALKSVCSRGDLTVDIIGKDGKMEHIANGENP